MKVTVEQKDEEIANYVNNNNNLEKKISELKEEIKGLKIK